jgi:hypothetical protein
MKDKQDFFQLQLLFHLLLQNYTVMLTPVSPTLSPYSPAFDIVKDKLKLEFDGRYASFPRRFFIYFCNGHKSEHVMFSEETSLCIMDWSL